MRLVEELGSSEIGKQAAIIIKTCAAFKQISLLLNGKRLNISHDQLQSLHTLQRTLFVSFFFFQYIEDEQLMNERRLHIDR